MITAIQAAEILQTGVVAVITVTVVFKILPMFRLDCYRQKMFALRDELFDYAAAGNISFDDPAYVLLRLQMNGMIRYGHQLTLFRASVTWLSRTLFGEKQTFVWHDAWERALENIGNDEVRRQLRFFHHRTATVAAIHILQGSVVLWCAMIVAALCLLVSGAAVGAKQLLKAAARAILSGPIDQRFIEEEAVGAMA
jgi:hypothetical protein